MKKVWKETNRVDRKMVVIMATLKTMVLLAVTAVLIKPIHFNYSISYILILLVWLVLGILMWIIFFFLALCVNKIEANYDR